MAVPTRHAQDADWFLWSRGVAGVAAVVAIEAGWVVTEVGRQPWIVHNYMTVQQGGDDERRRVDHVPRRSARSISRSGSRSILVHAAHEPPVAGRAGHRRVRRAVRTGRRRCSDRCEVPSDELDEHVRRRAVLRRDRVRGVRGADFGAGFWDLIAGGAERGERPRALIDHSIGPVWEANHVWLIFCLVVLWTAFSARSRRSC